jgi:creatinine amidohydrolase/Fe(II)-dependent formamide hydrolase-like protein
MLLALSWPALLHGQTPSATSPNPDMPRPIDAYDSVFIEELTWLEVRDAMRAGKTTAIIATGGIEMNGPYLATGKHNYILRATTEAIARKLGNALVAPIIPFVPEGAIDPPTSHMRYPGTISLQEDTYRRLLTDIAASLRAHGFKHIIMIADSGGNQAGMKEVAAALAEKWAGKTTIHYIPEYYDYPGLMKWLESQGIRQVDEGHHDDLGISSLMMTVDPNTVRMRQRLAKGKFSINGVNLAPAEKTIILGKKAVEYRATITVEAIKKAIGR